MTKAQALALMAAIQGQQVPASAVMSWPQGVETWSVQLDPSFTYTGAQIGELASYCASRGLRLTAVFASLGVV